MTTKFTPFEIQTSNEFSIALSSQDFDFKSLNRRFARLSSKNEEIYCQNILVLDSVTSGTIGVHKNVLDKLNAGKRTKIECTIELRNRPESYDYIKKKIVNQDISLTKEEIDQIVHDIKSERLSELEKSAFIFSQYFQEYKMNEIEHLCKAIAYSGETIDFPATAYDKHSLGGVPGNKVTLLIVPIIAAAGLPIPKTSSRAITSPSGTADTMEALGCEISFTSDEIKEIVNKTNGCIVWGGALNLAPADDILIKEIEFPLGINPKSMMMASIMAKKKALGIDFMVLDIPTGKGCKVTTMEEATALSRAFGELGHRLGIQVECGITFGSLPVGHTVGPALEAREALKALLDPLNASTSLIEKSTALAGILLEMSGKAMRGQGQNLAKEILNTGKAYKKMQEIIEAQGGNPNMTPEDIPIGEYICEFKAPSNGWPADIDNTVVTEIAQTAGAPTDKGAGIQFIVKKESVKAGDIIFRIHSSSAKKIEKVESLLPKLNPITIEGMLLGRI
jgi:AMP phosphorylase